MTTIGVSSGRIAWTEGAPTPSAVIGKDGPPTLTYYWQQEGQRPWNTETVATGNYESSQIAWTGSSVVMTAIDISNSNLCYWWGPLGNASISNHMQTVATGQIYSDPAIAWAGDAVVITAETESGLPGLFYFWQPAGSDAPWIQVLVAEGNYIYPSIAFTGSYVVITAVGLAGNLYYWWGAVGDPTIFNNIQTVATGDFGAPSIAATGGNTIVIAATDADSNLKCWSGAASPAPFSPASFNLQTVANGNYASPAIAYVGNPGQAVVIAANDYNPDDVLTGTGNFGNLYYWFQDDPNAPWVQVPVAGASEATGVYGDASIAWSGSDIIISAVRIGAIPGLFYWWGSLGGQSISENIQLVPSV